MAVNLRPALHQGERRIDARDPAGPASATLTWSGRCDGEHTPADGPRIGRGSTFDRYTVLHCLGSGGFGVVYAAYDPALDRRVAVKVLRPDRRSETHRDRLLGEARALARLSHPNVIAIHDVGIVDGQVFLAMEMVEGTDLHDWLARRDRPWPQVLAMMVQAGRGLAAAHRHGLVHGDFKPSNAIVGPEGRVRVIDFGLVSMPDQPGASRDCASPQSAPRRPAGTLGFMAPEQLRGEAVGVAADQFSFCASVYLALGGRMPFGADAPRAVLARIEAGRVEPPRVEGNLPERIRRVLLRGLSREPARRYPSMDALVAALERGAAPVWRRPMVSAGLVGALVAGAGWLSGALVPSTALCSGAEDKLAAVWNGQRKGEIQAVLADIGTPHADAAWSKIEEQVGGYVATWGDAYRDTCAATRVRGEQSEALMDLRLSCLDRRLQRVAATTELLASPDHLVLERAAMITHFLPDLRECADAAGLSAVVSPPAEARAAIERERGVVERGQTLLALTRVDAAVSVLEPAVTRARDLGYPPLEAEALLGLGEAQGALGQPDQARALLLQAAAAAQRGRDDYALARVWAALVDAEAGRREFERGLEWASMAEATLERLGGAPAIAATLEHNVARLLVDAGRLEPALPHYRRAIALYQQAHGDDHPFVAKARFGMAHVHERAGRLDEARGEYEAAVAVSNRALGEGHPIEGVLLEAIARVAQAEGQPERAVEALEQAEQVHAALDPDSVALAAVRFELARVLAGMRREPDRARALAQSASALAMHHHDDARARDLRAQIADWLTERESMGVEPGPEVAR